MQVVLPSDRDKFLDICLRQRTLCDGEKFKGPRPTFRWESAGVSESAKVRKEYRRFWKIPYALSQPRAVHRERFWHAYACAYNRDVSQCPVDGAWSSWSPWSECSATCDIKGKQTRRRTCTNPVPVRGGNKCQGSMLRSRPCLGLCTDATESVKGVGDNGQEEARAYLNQVHTSFPQLLHDCFETHCTFSTVERVIRHKHIRDKYWSSLACIKFGGACPVDGTWGTWGPWSTCSLQCGAGTRTRTRSCNQPEPAFGGHPCKGPWHKQDSCVGRDCAPSTTETFTEWTQWSSCSQSCGGYGVQTATRVCLRALGCDLEGVLTPYVNRSRPCYLGDCPVAGGWSEWAEWSDCSALCGTGRQSRMRLCDSPYPTGGLSCFGEPLEFRLCDGSSCSGQTLPTEEETSAVQEVSPGKGESVVLAGNDEYAAQPINRALEALYTSWSSWTTCSVSCGMDGTRVRTRSCSPQTTPMPPCEGEVRQIQFCNVYVCPVPGGWSDWMPWTPCSKTCEVGKRFRYRACNNPLPKFGGSCAGDSYRVETCTMPSCPHVMKEVVDCNSQPCPVHGSWAEWGEWSRCSTLCGMGTRARDRTCTDPAPSFGGKACMGPGTDVAHCFSGPCRDMEDRAVHLAKRSWIRFAPRNRPARYLTLYLHFRPISPDGFILRRYRQCRSVFDDEHEEGKNDEEDGDSSGDKSADGDQQCQLVVSVKLKMARVLLDVEARGATLNIASNVTLLLGAWHEVLVEVLKSGASLRINDQKRLHASFSQSLDRDLDFDSYMVIGAVENKTLGFEGSICTLSINFRPQDLFASADWEGQGTPVGRHGVSAENINPSVQLPHFRGLYYASLRLPYKSGLDVRLTLWLDEGDGLILYTRGVGPGSHFSLGMRGSRLIVCLRCTTAVKTSCHHAEVLKLRQWYQVALTVNQLQAEVRIDQSQASQLTCRGNSFTPEETLFIGGRGIPGWGSVQKATNYTKGFYGTLGTAVVNGRVVSFRHAALLGRDGRLNPDGYSRAIRITPVLEHQRSVVTLHCDIGQAMESDVQVKVIWLFSDTVLEPSDTIEIVKPVGGQKQVGTLKLLPGGHREGLYACVVSRDGRLVLSHVFPVFLQVSKLEAYEGKLEWMLLQALLILLPLAGLACFLVAKFGPRFWGRKEEPTDSEDTDFDLYLPTRRGLHTEDSKTEAQQYLASEESQLQKIRVRSFGPPDPRILTITPGTSSRRVVVPADGTMKIGEDRRQNTSASYVP
ncbi:hypothetical protein BaRGS_00001077, partial [Batillaria attramentaria]